MLGESLYEDWRPHVWVYEATGQDNDEDEPDDHQEDDSAENNWSWTQSGSQWTLADSAGATPAFRVHLGMGRHGAFLLRHGLNGNHDDMPPTLPPAYDRRDASMKAYRRGGCEHIAYRFAQLA